MERLGEGKGYICACVCERERKVPEGEEVMRF